MTRRFGLVVSVLTGLALAAPAAATDRNQPPKPGPARPLNLPPVERFALSNGLPVFLVPIHEVPVVEVVLVVRSGATSDPKERLGLAAMTADMLDEGAAGKDALGLADAFDFLGAELGTAASWDSSRVRLHVPVARLGEALPLMADVVLRPDFQLGELERLRKEALTALLQDRDSPRQIASRGVAQAVFGKAHRYAIPEVGTPESLAALGVDDLKGFHVQHYTPGNAALIVVGDVSETIRAMLEGAFGGWAKGGSVPAPIAAPPQVEGRQIWLVDKPGAPQSAIRIGRVAPARLTPDYHALRAMNTLLGGSFTSRLNENLREQHGYTYGAGSGFIFGRSSGVFLAGSDVQTDATAAALGEFLRELERIRVPPADDETERARNYLALGYAEDFETTRQVAAQIVEQVVYELPEDFFSTFVPKVLAVDAKEMCRVAEAHIDPLNLAIVIVGDRAKVEQPLRGLGVGSIEAMSIEDVMGPAPSIE